MSTNGEGVDKKAELCYHGGEDKERKDNLTERTLRSQKHYSIIEGVYNGNC